MARIRKRPIEVEAMQMRYRMTMHAPEREPVTCEPGDWLVCDVEGHHYFVKNSIAMQTYEIVDPEHDS